MASYSALFSSGLLAPHTPRQIPSSPGLLPSSPIDPIDRELTPTPTPTPTRSRSSTISSVRSNTSNSTTTSTTHGHEHSRPRLRKRRSSLTPAAAPLPSVKSPARTARHSLMSPTRSRSGSLANAASEGNSLVARMRSGSLGGAVRPRRMLMRTPTAPPPTVPLPPLPISTADLPPLSAPPTGDSFSFFSRPPLAHRAHTIDNNGLPPHEHGHFLSPDFASKLAMAMRTPDIDREMEIDRDGGGGYFERIDEMKEN